MMDNLSMNSSTTRRNSRQMLGRVVVSKTGKRFGEVHNITFDTRTGELLQIQLKNPTGYCEGLDLEKSKEGHLMVPFSSVVAVGDFVVIAEEDII